MCNLKTNSDAGGAGPRAADRCGAQRALTATGRGCSAVQLERLLLVALCTTNRCK